MKKYNNLPIYKMVIDEFDTITGVDFISLVDEPAIMVDWVAMSDKINMHFSTDDKMVITGPAMIPNVPIYRYDTKGEYYVSFDEPEIEKIARKFNREQRTLGINFMHEENSQVENSVIIEQWFIADPENDKAKTLGFDLPKGTWMVSVHFSDVKFWNEQIKTKKVRGFSIEGYLNMLQMKTHSPMKFETAKLATGEEVYVDGAIEIGSYVYTAKPQTMIIDGKKSEVQYPIYDAVIELEDGTVLTCTEGKIVTKETKTAVAQSAAQKENKDKMNKTKMTAEAKTKDGVVLYTTAESFVEGSDVWITNEAGEQSPAADGDYVLENGATITVKDGKVSAVVDAAPEEPAAAAEADKAVEEVKNAMAKLEERLKTVEANFEALSKKNTELSDKFSNMPGKPSATIKDDKETSKEQVVGDTIYEKLAAIKKQNKK